MADNEMVRKSVTVRGLSGLRNLGNTCYMNAAIQCLVATDIFSAFFRNKDDNGDYKFVDVLTSNVTDELAKKERKRLNLKDADEVAIETRDQIKAIKKSMTYAYFRLVKLMMSDNIVVEPREFKSVVGSHNQLFNGFSQNDSQELMNCVIDTIHEELKSSVIVNYFDVPDGVVKFRQQVKEIQKNIKESEGDMKMKLMNRYRDYLDTHMEEYTVNSSLEYWERFIKKSHSIVRDIFTGMSYISTKCNDCRFTTLMFEPFIMLTLPIPESRNSADISDCLKTYASTVQLTGKDKYQCDNCKDLKDAEQSTYLWETPEILIVHLKRFITKQYGNSIRTEKNGTMITYPLQDLDITPTISPYNRNGNYKYELYGVVRQHGSLGGGHYTAVCKNSINNKWYEFDDSHVAHIPDAKVKDEVITQSAYILFYKVQYPELD
jgi:ubiquitin C-terminal hydrolase